MYAAGQRLPILTIGVVLLSNSDDVSGEHYTNNHGSLLTFSHLTSLSLVTNGTATYAMHVITAVLAC